MTANTTPEVALFLDPTTRHFERDRLFNLDPGALNGADLLAPYVHLREWMAQRGIPVHTADVLERGEVRARRNVYVSMGVRTRYPSIARREDTVMSAFFALECPVVEPKLYRDLHPASTAFRRTFSYSSAAALAPYITAPIEIQPFRIPQSFDAVHEHIWGGRDRGFMTMINANKLPRLKTQELYTERMRAVAFFEGHGELDLYGMGWDVPPYRMGQTWIPATGQRMMRSAQAALHRVHTPELLAASRRAWRGTTADKAVTLGSYRFAVCFENMILEGWITEKLFDCLYSGTVPVYLGAPDIERWVPRECFIDMRDFAGYAELREYLHSLGPDEVDGYREAAREFLGSVRYRPFSREAFAELFGRLVREDAGASIDSFAG